MATYIVRRILWGIVLIILVSALTFLFFNILPSADPAVLRAGRNSSPATIEHIRVELGLNRPVYQQFFDYMTEHLPALELRLQLLLGGLGPEPHQGSSAGHAVADHGRGGALAAHRDSRSGSSPPSSAARWSTAPRWRGALAGVSFPDFWLGLVVLFLFANDIGRFHVFPGAGSYVGLTVSPVHWFTSLLMPWFVLASTSAAVYSRVLRGASSRPWARTTSAPRAPRA